MKAAIPNNRDEVQSCANYELRVVEHRKEPKKRVFASKPQVALSRIKQQMHREVGHSNMLEIVRNIRDNMEFLELPGGGTHHPSSETRHCGRAQVDEVEDDLISFRDPGHRAGPGGLD